MICYPLSKGYSFIQNALLNEVKVLENPIANFCNFLIFELIFSGRARTIIPNYLAKATSSSLELCFIVYRSVLWIS